MSMLDANGSVACAECGRRARDERDRLKAENAKLWALRRDMYLVVELLDMDGMALQTHGKSSDWRTLKERYDELTGVDG